MSESKTKLILVCGLPGSGKTTLSRKLAQEIPAIRFCPDEWMQDFGISLWDGEFRDNLEGRFWKLGKELLSLGQSVILEYGFWAKAERDDKFESARALGVGVELHFLDPSVEELKARLGKRGMEGDVELIEKVEEYSDKLERPDANELSRYDNRLAE